MQKNALLFFSLAIIVLALKAEAIASVNNIVCGRAVCPSGWVSSDANTAPTCPSDCPNSCKIMDDVCCPGRKYGVCNPTISVAPGSGGVSIESSSRAKPTTSGLTSGSASAPSGFSNPTAASSTASSMASAASNTAASSAAASSATAATAASRGSLIQPSYMVGFVTIMFCIVKSF